MRVLRVLRRSLYFKLSRRKRRAQRAKERIELQETALRSLEERELPDEEKRMTLDVDRLPLPRPRRVPSALPASSRSRPTVPVGSFVNGAKATVGLRAEAVDG